MMTERYEKRELKRFLLLLDAAVVVVFFGALAFLARDAYVAGAAEASAETQRQSVHLWYMARDAGILLLAFAYIAARFLRAKWRQITTPWL